MSIWRQTTLGESCEFFNGKAHEKIIDENGRYIVVNSKFISSNQAVYKKTNQALFPVNKNDILMVMSDVPKGKALSKCFLVKKDDEYTLNQRICCIRSEKFNTEFLFYHLNRHPYFLSFDNGENQTNLRKGDILKCPLFVPPLPEQKRIVTILDDAFAGIDQAIANTERNLANARELFDSYLNEVFTCKGEGWSIKKWGELCHFVRGPFGGSLKKSMFKESGYVVYEQKHAIHDHFEQLRYFIDEEKFNEMQRFEVKANDIIMSCSGVTLGRAAVVPEGIPKGIINQALLKLTPNENLHTHYLKYWIRSNVFQSIIFEYSGGAAIPNVPSAKILKTIEIPVPSIDEQRKVVMQIEKFQAEVAQLTERYQRKLDDLSELRQSLLQKAFTGQLTADWRKQQEVTA